MNERIEGSPLSHRDWKNLSDDEYESLVNSMFNEGLKFLNSYMTTDPNLELRLSDQHISQEVRQKIWDVVAAYVQAAHYDDVLLEDAALADSAKLSLKNLAKIAKLWHEISRSDKEHFSRVSVILPNIFSQHFDDSLTEAVNFFDQRSRKISGAKFTYNLNFAMERAIDVLETWVGRDFKQYVLADKNVDWGFQNADVSFLEVIIKILDPTIEQKRFKSALMRYMSMPR